MIPPGSPVSTAAIVENAPADPAQPKKSFRTLMTDWAENTGMHGLPNITRSQSPIKKCIWTLLLLAGLCIMIWQIVGIVQKYYLYPIIVQRSIETQMPRNFPAVSICNKNAARMSKVAESFTSGNTSSASANTSSTAGATPGPILATSATALALIASLGPAATIATPSAVIITSAATAPTPALSTTRAGPSPGPPGRKRRAAPMPPVGTPPPPSASKYSWMTGSIYSSDATRNLSAMGPDTIPDSVGITYTFLDYYNSLTATWKMQIGNQLSDFLIECSVGPQYCKANNFSLFLHPLYGNCFTFNAARTGQDRVTVLQSGPLYGLKLTLYIEQKEYIGALANSAGVTVVIHEPNKQPFPEDTGISVSPGQETYIGLKEIYTKRLAAPYSDDCQKEFDTANKDNNMYAVSSNYSLPNLNYSQSACMKTCIQRQVEKKCNCSSPNLPISDPTVDPMYNSSYRFCMYEYNSTTGTISTNAKCMQKAERDSFPDCRAMCKQDCDEYTYTPLLSQSMWPSDSYESDSQRQIIAYNQNIKKTVQTLPKVEQKTFMSKNFVKIFVYFDDPMSYLVVSTEGYDVLAVLSDFGGQVGLWLGLSVLTLFEIVEMFVDLFMLMFKKTQRPVKPRDAWRWTATNAMLRRGGANTATVNVLTLQQQQQQHQQALDITEVKAPLPQTPPHLHFWYEAAGGGVKAPAELTECGKTLKTAFR